MIPFLDLKAGYDELRDEIDDAVLRVAGSGRYINGPEVERFEHSFASFCDADFCVGVGNGLGSMSTSHARALQIVLMEGKTGETYLIGGRSERTNLEVVETICDMLDRKRARAGGEKHRALIQFVPDRPGHDRRYAVDPTKIESELGWERSETFESGIEKTIDWYLEREDWWRPLRDQRYAGERLGQLS